MEEAQTLEWSKAQEITFRIDLVGAAKQHLRFLEAVDNLGCLYDGPALERAIYRYKNCWLPLLVKNTNCSILEGPLVLPLDCEWIWHCHRLSPVQYKRDCEKIYGRVLGKLNVLSTTEGACSEKTQSIWNRIYVTEPYNLDLVNIESSEVTDEPNIKSQGNIDYDLAAAVKRQSSFFRKVSKMMNYGDRFLEAASARYKGFLYMIKIVKERKLETLCVPTHDIDLMWHTHQLNPVAYCRDMKAIHGRVVDHNDRDSEPKKTEVRFLRTKELWEELFGGMYCVGGAVTSKSKWVAPLMDHVQGLGDNNKARSGSNKAASEDQLEFGASSCACWGKCVAHEGSLEIGASSCWDNCIPDHVEVGASSCWDNCIPDRA